MEEVRTCIHCGNILSEEGGHSGRLCRDCVETFCTLRECHLDRRLYTDDTLYFCPDCYESHYYCCENCGRIMHEDKECQLYINEKVIIEEV